MEETREPLLTARDVARLLRLKTSTVYEAAADGRIPCVRLWSGNRKSLIRFRPEDIDKLATIGSASEEV